MDLRPIAIVAPLYAPAIGGVERHVERLATGLASRGLAVEVLATEPGLRRPSVAEREGIIVRRFPTLLDGRESLVSPALMAFLWRHAARYRLIHAHNLHTIIPLTAGIAARRRRIPYVVTPHFHGSGHTPVRRLFHLPYRPLAAFTLKGAARIAFNSAAEEAIVRARFGTIAPAVVIPPGIDLPALTANEALASDPGVMILSVGRLEAYKQVDKIVGALSVLSANHRLVVVGDGVSRQAIADAGIQAGVEGRLEILAHVSPERLAQLFERADVFVSLSLHEAFGLAVLEAAAAGCPVVASDIPAHRELVVYVPPGRITLVPQEGQAATLAAAIESACRMGRLPRFEFSGAANDSGWHLPTWEGLVDAVVALYEDALRS